MDWRIESFLMFCLLMLYVIHKIIANEQKEVYVCDVI